MDWYRITNKKMLLLFGLSFLWVAAGWTLYALIGVKNGPKGGLDSIANAIVYVLFWKTVIYAPPALLMLASTFLWLWQNHRKAIIWVLAGILIVFLSGLVYDRYIKKIIHTPEWVASHTERYVEWDRKRIKGGVSDKWTGSDLVCEYVKDLVSHTVAEYRSLHPEEDIPLRTAYIDAALEEHYRELEHVEGWEYIPDVRDIIPARGDGDNEFLLNNSEMRAVAAHYQKTLNRSHWYDRYQFESFVIAEWYSWLPMLAIFYDDGTMDLIIAT